MSTFVLDTSAIITILNQEEGWDTVLKLLEKAREDRDIVYLPFIALMELEYLMLRKFSPEETMAVLGLVSAWPVLIVESMEEWRHQAAKVKSEVPVSLADAWIASLAMLKGAELVHKDPEYDKVLNLLTMKLPYKV